MKNWGELPAHCFLGVFIFALFLPLYVAIVVASHESSLVMQAPLSLWPGFALLKNIQTVVFEGMAFGGEPVWRMLVNSFVMALLIALGKIILAMLAAFALVYFNLPWKKCIFALIFSTMMLPVEVRIVSTFQVVVSFGWLNSFSGLCLPLMLSATATFLFRQFFRTLPRELVDAATLDGAGPWRFLRDMLLPLAKTQIAALFVILFVYGWNQYLWPLVITTDADMSTIVMGIRYLAGVSDQVPQWSYILSTALIAMLPPCLLLFFMQAFFEEGLVN